MYLYNYTYVNITVAILGSSIVGPLTTLDMKASRGPRPKVRHFCAVDVVAELGGLLKLRDPGFLWDGTSGIAGDVVARLKIYAKVLAIILKFACTGFPAQGDLQEVFMILQAKHKVLAESGGEAPKLCTDAAVEYRGMCKQIYDFKKEGKCR